MRLAVKVIPNASKNLIKEEASQLKVHLTASPTDGKANAALIEVMAKHFNVAKRQVVIVRGQTSRHKVVEIEMGKDGF
ncbi:MAG: DUF167 domain-containing protein [Planctomycetota bacterium]